MRAKLFVAALLITGACAGSDGGGLDLGVSVEGLTDSQNFCMTWTLYEEVKGAWVPADSRMTPLCGKNGSDLVRDFATCTDGRRFLVEYNVVFGGTAAGSATATSGGGEADVCLKNHDKNTTALVQYRNEGDKGGVNPGIAIDQVCTNDKLVSENGKIVSALWVQPDSCTGDQPDEFCSIGVGPLTTARSGLTADGLTQFIFSTADPASDFTVFYLVFEPAVPDMLVLNHAPYVLMHWLIGGSFGKELVPAAASFRYNATAGFFYQVDSHVIMYVDHEASCNGPLALADSFLEVQQTFDAPLCAPSGSATIAGVIPTGGSTFRIVFECGAGEFTFRACDAAAATVCPEPAP